MSNMHAIESLTSPVESVQVCNEGMKLIPFKLEDYCNVVSYGMYRIVFHFHISHSEFILRTYFTLP